MLYYAPSPFVARRDALLAMAALLLLIVSPTASGQAPVTPPSPPPPVVIGKIARIDVKGNLHIPTAEIARRLTQKSGTATASNSLNVDAVKDMGVFTSVDVTTAPDLTGGTDVTCTVVENPVVKVIHFTANTPDGKPTVPEATLIAHMHTAIGQVFSNKTLAGDLETLFNHDTGYVRSLGYLFDASPSAVPDPATGILNIPLFEGFIGQIEVQGNNTVPAADVLSTLGLKQGDLLDLNAVQAALTRVQEKHWFAPTEQAQSMPNEDGKYTVTVTVRGPRGIFGTLTAGPEKSAAASYSGMVGGPVIVPVRVNDHTTGHFLLVTNTDLSQISGTFAADLGLTPQPMLVDGQPYYVDSQAASSVSLDRMALGGTSGVEFQAVSLPVADLSDLSKQIGQTIDGILGADLLSRVTVGIDFPRRQITFWNHGHLTAEERQAAGFAGATEVTLEPLYTSFPLPGATAQIQNGTAAKSLPMFIATGSGNSVLSAATAKSLGMTSLPDPDDPTMILSRASRLDLGGLSLNAPLFQLTDVDNGPGLGVNVLQQYRLLLDGPAHTAYFAPEVTVTGGTPQHPALAVPFQFDHQATPLIVIQVSINGRPPLPFIFDTGCSPALTIDRQAAQTLGLTVDDGSDGTVNGSFQAQTAPVSTAVLQGRTAADNVSVSLEQAVVIDLGSLRDVVFGSHIVGIIGAGILNDTAVHFDFPAHILTFYPNRADVPAMPGAVTLPLSENITENEYFAALPDKDGTPMRLLVDTGSEGTIIPAEMSVLLHPKAAVATTTGMLGSIRFGQYLLLPRFPDIGLPTGRQVVTALPTNDTPRHWSPGTLGIDLLSRLAVTFDIPHMRLLLGPPSIKTPPTYNGWTGVRLAQEGGRFQITQVLPASPAAHAGLKAGDVLTTIDGRSLAGLSLYNARNLVDGLAGTPVVFVVRRGNTPLRTIRFRRADRDEDPPSPLNGIYGRQDAADPFVVTAVVPGCPAARAGLATGDTITQINGLATRTLTMDQWGTLLLETRLTLTVIHAGATRTFALVNAPSDLKNSYPPTGKIAASGQEK